MAATSTITSPGPDTGSGTSAQVEHLGAAVPVEDDRLHQEPPERLPERVGGDKPGMYEPKPSLIVVTDGTDRYAGAVQAAAERACAQGVRLLAYDVAASGKFTDARPNFWAAEGEKGHYDHPLEPVDLEKLGQHGLAVQVERARRAGADAYGWLPNKSSGQALVEYAAQEHAQLILLAPELGSEFVEEVEAAKGDTNDLQVEMVTAA